MKWFLFFVMIFSLVGHYCQANEVATITYAKLGEIGDPRHEYFIELLELVLEKTETQPSTKLKATNSAMTQRRAVQELAHRNDIDVVWAVTSIDREKLLLPVRIPLLKGLLGYRVLLIRKEDRDIFSAVSNIEDLRQFVAGQGHDWPDTEILRANHLSVVTSPVYHGLFRMLAARRFDYFPRGINEVWQELDTQKYPGLIIEEHLMLHYPLPIYFFVNRNNQVLANRIEEGLKRSIEDGSFERLLVSFPGHKMAFETGRVNQRNIIQLHNPTLPAITPLQDHKLWHSFK